MYDDRIFGITLHVVVKLSGRCSNCNVYNERKIHDYGKLTYGELEKKLDGTAHQIKPLTCKKCKTEFSPKHLTYFDIEKELTITKMEIGYGNYIDEETAQKMLEGHKNRYKIFEQNEEDFWQGYEDYALAEWTQAIKELSINEFRDAYKRLNIDADFSSAAKFRKDVLNRFKTEREKREFWRAANHFFIYLHTLEIGPNGWAPEKDVKAFGRNRVRYVVLNFPLDENLEGQRTKYIGSIVRKEKGDNAFLFRRISQLTSELERSYKKNTEYYHQNERLKAKIANLENKLHELKVELRKERENKQIVKRDPKDVRKIHQLKSFVTELMEELKEKERIIDDHQLVEEEHEATPVVIEEPKEEKDVGVDIDKLRGKIIGIIGGKRDGKIVRRDINGISMITHAGSFPLDHEYERVLKTSDVIVVLTQAVSHRAMWEAKAHAITENKPICYSRVSNLERILKQVAEEIEG